MRSLKSLGFVDALGELVLREKVPVLGICLGMQLLARGSEEGTSEGLGWIAADTKRITFPKGIALPVPHMGWSETTARREGLFAGFELPPRFYYVHSYHVVCDDRRDVAATCRYGIELCASIRHGHVFGTQFHPEKSHRFGMTLLRSFVSIVRGADRGAACSA
jgi:glutamine amidotransferase